MSGYSPILELGDAPLTPREKVARCIVGPRNPVPDNSKFTLDQPRQVKWGAASESEKSDALWAADAILTALASGSGDRAELARLADMADWMADGDPGANGSVLLSASVAAEHAADLKALIAENAALRASEMAALKECSEWARKAGEAIGKLETSEAAGIVEGWRDRATEAEHKLAEALKHLKAMSHVAPRDFEVEAAYAFLSKEA